MTSIILSISKALPKNHIVKNIISYKNDRYCVNFKFIRNMSCIFKGIEDRYKGMVVDAAQENCPLEEFPERLKGSLELWRKKKKRGVWFKVDLKNTCWIPILVENGFNFHHANRGYVMLYTWLPQEKDNIPSYAHTMLAVGGIVINENGELLVVKEKHALTPHWKFPGGLVEPGENFVESTIREVKEETNIDCEFHSFVSLRHAHKIQFGCSDLYIVFSMKALSSDIIKSPREIVDCKWMGIEEILNSDDVTEFNKSLVKGYLDLKDRKIKIDCKDGFHQLLKKAYQTYNIVDDVPNDK